MAAFSPISLSLVEPNSFSLLPSLSISSQKPFSLSFQRYNRFNSIYPLNCSSSITIENQKSETTQEEQEFSRTRLIAQNVPWSSTADDIRALFQNHGTVLDVELSMHNMTRNRGLAFVEMDSAEEAAAALAKLEAFEYEGRTLRLNYAKLKKKKVPLPVQPKPAVVYNLFVANLPFAARSKDLREFFQSNGSNVVSAEVIFSENPRQSLGYGFVSFKTKKEADEALTTFDAKELMGRIIRLARSKRFVKLESELNSQSEDGEDMPADSEQAEAVDNM
ncbi:28 kDa ribonucleoprotein, chloroplastic [Amaranthus tricolor]|uniref:28 kDa ribonucleoprotein, chloroplastic n=1 Tax=Amaranthus tricolor TaxID=29722 RepID=UPI00258AB381|nr:28 kDa ribonucleoprotein, chloroplastic [Amaranthus tricolor]XP_057533485.1 28 kDa ribonucleoprotein, chloroplastic [Amaranthus tricolor]